MATELQWENTISQSNAFGRLQRPIYNFLFWGGGAALINQCSNSHILQNNSILLMQLRVLGGKAPKPPPPGISVLGRLYDTTHCIISERNMKTLAMRREKN